MAAREYNFCKLLRIRIMSAHINLHNLTDAIARVDLYYETEHSAEQYI
jgi:hypothetical protein